MCKAPIVQSTSTTKSQVPSRTHLLKIRHRVRSCHRRCKCPSQHFGTLFVVIARCRSLLHGSHTECQVDNSCLTVCRWFSWLPLVHHIAGTMAPPTSAHIAYSTLQNRPHPLRKRHFCGTPVELGYPLLVSANRRVRQILGAQEGCKPTVRTTRLSAAGLQLSCS